MQNVTVVNIFNTAAIEEQKTRISAVLVFIISYIKVIVKHYLSDSASIVHLSVI